MSCGSQAYQVEQAGRAILNASAAQGGVFPTITGRPTSLSPPRRTQVFDRRHSAVLAPTSPPSSMHALA